MDVVRQLLDEAPVYIYVLDRDLRYVYLNQAALRDAYGGRSLEEVVGRSGRDFLTDEDSIDLESTDRHIMDSDQPAQVYEALMGAILYSSKWPVHDRFGAVIGVAGVSFNVTSVVVERVRGGADFDLMVDMVTNTGMMTRSLARMIASIPRP